MSKGIRIVFFDVCGGATKFLTQKQAEEAAEIYAKSAGYACEAFRCEKQHPLRSGRSVDACWHVRGKIRPVSTTATAKPFDREARLLSLDKLSALSRAEREAYLSDYCALHVCDADADYIHTGEYVAA